MNRIFLLSTIPLFVFAGQAGFPVPGDHGEAPPAGIELFSDPGFTDGLAVSPLSPQIVQQNGGFAATNTDTLHFHDKAAVPTWQMCQWASKYDLAGAEPAFGEDGSISYANTGKRITRHPDGSLTLEVTASREYDRPRKGGEPWVHLLVQQNFKKRPNIGRAKHLYFSMELTIDHAERMMSDTEYDTEVHTAQSPFFFSMGNVNPTSPDYGTSLWVGMSSFDYRYPEVTDREVVMWDIGTATFIYDIPQTAVWETDGFHNFGRVHRTREGLDVLPLIKRAVAAMQERGSFLNTALEDLEISGMNFGWEVPGTFDVGLTVKGMSLVLVE